MKKRLSQKQPLSLHYNEIHLYFMSIFVEKIHVFLIFAPVFLDNLYFFKIVHLTNFVCGLIKRLVKSRSFSYADTANERHVARNCLRTGQTYFARFEFFEPHGINLHEPVRLEKQGDENRRFSTAEQNLAGVQVWKNTKNSVRLAKNKKVGLFPKSNRA